MRRLLVAFLFLTSLSFVHAQYSSVSNYTRVPGYYTLGLNIGLAYQSSDVTARPFEGGGWGLTLAKNLYYAPGAPVSFDIRGRFLTTRQIGLDGARSTDIASNPVLSDYLSYPQEFDVDQGFAFYNHRTRTYELALEGVFELNRLREQTQFILSFYGGVGLDWYRTRMNLLDEFDSPYYQGFSTLRNENSSSQIRRSLRNDILDDDYETNAAGFDGNSGKIGFMPSLGFDLGYEFSPGASIHLGHRLTFAGTDDLDGNSFEAAQQDLYHYTHAALRFIIQPNKEREVAQRPIIEVTTPVQSPFTSNRRRTTVRANIRNVQSSMDVQANYNGRNVSFDFNNGQFSKEVILEDGQNILAIEAVNAAGRAREEVVLYYADTDIPTPTGTPPTVTILSPAQNPYTTRNSSVELRASVQEVNTKSDIEVYLNGRTVSFDLLRDRTTVVSNLNLERGNNEVRIQVRNRWGQDQAQTQIRYEVKEEVAGPTVRIITPDYGLRTRDANVRLVAEATNVRRKEDLTVSINGRRVGNFRWDSNRSELSVELGLDIGRNNIVVRANTLQGSAEDNVEVTRERTGGGPVAGQSPRPPRVRITEPRDYANVNRPEVELRADLTNIDSRRQVTILINGRTYNDFSLSRGRLRADVPLESGNNRILVRAQNSDGRDEDGVNVRYKPSPPPKVTINQPVNGSTTEDANIRLEAQTQHVANKSQLELRLNGSRVTNFNYNSNSRMVTADLRLRQGSNQIRLRATTDSGNDQDEVNVTYRPVSRPTVRITVPSNDPYDTNESSVQVKAVVEHVSDRSEISPLVRGQVVRNFNFSNGQVSFTANLQKGNNLIEVQVNTAGGRASDKTTVVYTQKPAPVVRFLKPARSGTRTTSPRQSFSVQIDNIEDKKELTVKFNNQTVNNYQYNTNTGKLTLAASLRIGENTMSVSAQTDAGQDQASTVIFYDKREVASRKPTVKITSISKPVTDPTNPNPVLASTILAKFTNVTSANQITLLINGESIDDFSYNTRTGAFSATVRMQKGNNTVVLKATTPAGSAEASEEVGF